MSTKDKCYIQGLLVPDIVLAYYKKESEDNAKPFFYRVYDVKYKNPCESTGIRNDRLQFLAYCFMYGISYDVTKQNYIEKKLDIKNTDEKSGTKDTYDTNWYSGLIFPSQPSKYSDLIAINRVNDDVYYHQFFIDIEDRNNTNQDFNWLW